MNCVIWDVWNETSNVSENGKLRNAIVHSENYYFIVVQLDRRGFSGALCWFASGRQTALCPSISGAASVSTIPGHQVHMKLACVSLCGVLVTVL